VYKFIRTAWNKSNEEAKDLTQEFFAGVFQPAFLSRADPSRGSFRTFVLASLKNYLRDRRKHEKALRRGGEAEVIPLSEEVSLPAGADPEKEFTRSWAEDLLAEALGELQHDLDGRGRRHAFLAFQEYCLHSTPAGRSSYQSVADKLGISLADVTNGIFEARRELRRILEARIGRYVASRSEIQEELRALFGT
jgi:RNA polymerase sigma-70 factor (ECF subfamily)